MRQSTGWVMARFKRLPWYGKVIALSAAAVVGYFLGQFLIGLVIDLVAFVVTMLFMLLLPVLLFGALTGGRGKRSSRQDDDQWFEDNDPRRYERTHAGDLPHF